MSKENYDLSCEILEKDYQLIGNQRIMNLILKKMSIGLKF
jgi:hypothetical protein